MADIVMPVLGPEMEEGRILRWMKASGETVREGEPILEVEGDKTTVEITAPESGVISIMTEAGVTVPIRQVIATIGGTAAGQRPNVPTPSAEPGRTLRESAAPSTPSERGEVRASPRAKRVAAEKGVDLSKVTGTGPNGMIQEKDVLEAAERKAAPAPAQPPLKVSPQARRLAEQLGVDLSTVTPSGVGGRIMEEDVRRAVATGATPSPPGPVSLSEEPTSSPANSPAPVPSTGLPDQGEVVSLSAARRVTAERMAVSWRSAPHATLQVEVDMRRAMRLREELNAEWAALGVRISVDALLVRAVASALSSLPEMNARWEEGSGIRRLKTISIGVAVDTERGLFVPVLKDVGSASLDAIAQRLADLVDRVRQGTLAPEEWSGGTFTITNLGPRGIDAFNPIVNPPQAGILAIGRIAKRPWVEGNIIVAAETATLSLAFDHRVIDGAPAADVLIAIKENLEHPLRLLAAGGE